MSGIYIHGMEIPSSCASCQLGIYRGYHMECAVLLKAVKNRSGERSVECPLVPVPEHGRLIDADALPEQMLHNLFEIEDKAEKELGFDQTLRRGMQYGHAVCVDAVNDAPTIIPADKEGEG